MKLLSFTSCLILCTFFAWSARCEAKGLDTLLQSSKRGYLHGKKVTVTVEFENKTGSAEKVPSYRSFTKDLTLLGPGRKPVAKKLSLRSQGWQSSVLKPGEKRQESLALSLFSPMDQEGKYVLEYGKGNKESETSFYIVKDYQARMETSLGTMVFAFYPEDAPQTVLNFITLSKKGFYKDLIFHRVIEGFMIQGGDPCGDGTGDAGYTIEAEFNKIKHVEGVLSMARGSEPDSASCQFFVCLDTHSHLDGNYTAFGFLVEGNEVLQKIGKARTTGRNGYPANRPLEPAEIKKVEVIELKKKEKKEKKEKPGAPK